VIFAAGHNAPVSRFDAAVVGGGLVGAAAAFELGRRGARTVLYDAADTGRATDAGAGILSPETNERDDASWVALVQAAGAHYDTLLPVLGRETGWARCGILQLATRESDVPAWEWLVERATGATEISPDDAHALVPPLGSVVRASHHPAAARVDGRMMCAAVRHAAAQHDVEIRDERVENVVALLDDATAVVIAGGAWSPAVSRQVGVELPVEPVRGQIIHLGVADHETGTWPIVQPVLGYYLVPWPDARVAVGATFEDAGFTPEVTAGGVHEVLRETLRVLPGLASATLREVRVGLRPVSVDDTPIIGALPGVDRMFACTGHGANGLLLGPLSGALVADAVLGNTPALPLEPYSPARFLSNLRE
jgi:D-amino-acid dehydrogenase